MDQGLEFFIRSAKADLKELKEDLKEDIGLLRDDLHKIVEAIDSLKQSRSLSIGWIAGVSSVCSVLTALVTIYFSSKH